MKVKIGKYPKFGSRKTSVVIERADTWSLDDTLAYIILPALLQLKDEKAGIPGSFLDSNYLQTSFDFYEEGDETSHEIAEKRWNDVLDKMIWSFQQLVENEYEEKYHHGNIDFRFEESDTTIVNPLNGKVEKTFNMIRTEHNTHWFDHEGSRIHIERMQEGFELFGKYYLCLWT